MLNVYHMIEEEDLQVPSHLPSMFLVNMNKRHIQNENFIAVLYFVVPIKSVF
jgi:hypothetical protein